MFLAVVVRLAAVVGPVTAVVGRLAAASTPAPLDRSASRRVGFALGFLDLGVANTVKLGIRRSR